MNDISNTKPRVVARAIAELLKCRKPTVKRLAQIKMLRRLRRKLLAYTFTRMLRVDQRKKTRKGRHRPIESTDGV